jgi:hypothetical protein
VVLDESRFKRLTHRQLMEEDLPPAPPQLVDGLVEAGTLGTLASLPETGKTRLALTIAARVAGGGGEVLGRRVLIQARLASSVRRSPG